MMPKHTLITVVFASQSSQMHYSALFLTPTQSLELYLMGAQNLGPLLIQIAGAFSQALSPTRSTAL